MLEKDKEYYYQYRDLLQKAVDKSENEFEKHLLYIAAGALGLSFTFISEIINIIDSRFIWLLIAGWISLILCILINLLSHIHSKTMLNRTINLIDKYLVGDILHDNELRNNIDKMNKKISHINTSTILLLVIGIALIIVFTSLNL